MKPIPLVNYRYKNIINQLALCKKEMHYLDKILIEDLVYNLKVNIPLKYYDLIALRVIASRYLGIKIEIVMPEKTNIVGFKGNKFGN